MELAILREKGYGIRAVARVMHRNPASISREIRRNIFLRENRYDPLRADHKARVRKHYSRFQWKKINEQRELKEFIVSCLKKHWNPAEIAGYMKRKKQPVRVSKNSIYRWLYSTQGIPYCQYLYSQRYTQKKRVPACQRIMIPHRVGIHERPRGATERTQYGHFECDTIVSGKQGQGAVSVLIDRKSRYVILNKLETLSPHTHVSVLRQSLHTYPVRSVTFDNGIENRCHEQLAVPTFFCDPYSSWQKGSVENVNKMVRRYLPKGTNLSLVSENHLTWIQDTINKKPRAILGFRSAYDIFSCCLKV
jgi:transposase, IS30 family